MSKKSKLLKVEEEFSNLDEVESIIEDTQKLSPSNRKVILECIADEKNKLKIRKEDLKYDVEREEQEDSE